MTNDEIRAAVAKLRPIAERVGPLHGSWDLIFDAEALIEGKRTLLPREDIEEALLARLT